MSKISDQNKHRKRQSEIQDRLLIPRQKINSLSEDKITLSRLGYFVGRKLDSGTFATVRYAEKTTLNGMLPLAVKIIDKAKASPVFTGKFLKRELAIWPQLHHKHIIQVENICAIQERIYVFMELASRGSVIEYLQTHGAVSEERGREWCKGMCQALKYCHSKGIVHRDLKCDNLLLDKRLQIKIGDFGFCTKCISKSRGGRSIYSETYCGSSSYVAPEVIEAKPYDPIPADVWSAGVCMYVILNNAMPFDDSNIIRMHEDQIQRRWQFTPDAAKKLSSGAKKLILRMLDPVIEMRPTMEQVLNSTWMRM